MSFFSKDHSPQGRGKCVCTNLPTNDLTWLKTQPKGRAFPKSCEENHDERHTKTGQISPLPSFPYLCFWAVKIFWNMLHVPFFRNFSLRGENSIFYCHPSHFFFTTNILPCCQIFWCILIFTWGQRVDDIKKVKLAAHVMHSSLFMAVLNVLV